MKRITALLCVMSMVVASLVGCGNNAANTVNEEVSSVATDATTATQTSEEAERTTFTLGFDASFPPYGYQDENGEYVGFDLDLAQEVCDRLGWELVKQPIDWDSKDMELTTGAIDCIWNGFTMSADRADKYAWSKPYVDNSQVFVVAKDSGIAAKADLAGKMVDVQADSSALEALSNDEGLELANTFAGLTQVADYNTAFMDLEAGAVDAVAMDIGVAKYQVESRKGEYVILDDTLATEVYAIGFALGQESLRDTVQEQLDAMASDGTFMEIASKWGLEESVTLGK